MKKTMLFMAALAAASLAPCARAVVTEKVTDDTFAAFSAGKFKNVSLDSDGRLKLAPAITNLATVTDPIIWAAAQDRKGDLFLGTGNKGTVYKLAPDGKLSAFFSPNEVMIHALAVDAKGRLYAASSPDGRVYRLNPDGSAQVYCSPGERYIWAMSFGPDGSLYLATGDHGKILRIPPGGHAPATAATYFECAEANITALAWDANGRLLAGTSPHGYLYQIDKADHGFVIFNSGEKEIHQIAVAKDGTIYVSTFAGKAGENASSVPHPLTISLGQAFGGIMSENTGPKTPGANADATHPKLPDAAKMAVPAQGGMAAMPGMPNMAALLHPSDETKGGGPSEGAIYRINTNGFYERYWSAPGEAIYSMLLLPNGRLLAGTGDKGRIYSISDRNHWTLLQQTDDGAQVAALLPDREKPGRYFAATSHPGKLYRLDFSLARSGTYTSAAFDATQKSQWGRLHPQGTAASGGSLEFSTRSGNTEKPGKTWSDWSKPRPFGNELAVSSPAARYLQFRVRFIGGANSAANPQLRRLRFYYQNFNAPPVIARVKVITQGFGIAKMPIPQMDGQSVNLQELLHGDPAAPGRGNPAIGAVAMFMQPPVRLTRAPGLCTVVWEAHDPNGDKLDYSVAIRGQDEKQWTTLAKKTTDTFYSFDSTGFPQGFYVVRVRASDLPSNTP
ncbi:MAG: hypothetical protein KGR98_05885, partial [Verrucomicrobia bacterium]|nr:hypothetical protein [Verrucomicrobiota bacterium]